MLDKDMREPFFLWLENNNEKIRIFQEVNISSSRCDAFSVTDRLTGYEIKSDADTYVRLASQTKNYDKYFDENYLVVGKSHAKFAHKHVPEHWGIICVGDDISVIRPSSPNKKAKLTNQMKLLWRKELQNILNRRKLPKYQSKSRKFVSDKIIEKLGEDAKSELIYELFEREYEIDGHLMGYY